jgi:hypothetical protein
MVFGKSASNEFDSGLSGTRAWLRIPTVERVEHGYRNYQLLVSGFMTDAAVGERVKHEEYCG